MKNLFLSLAIIVSSTGYADTTESHIIVPSYTVASSKRLYGLDDKHVQKNRIVKSATEGQQVLANKSQKSHILKHMQIQRNKIVKSAENKHVLTKRSKKLHTLDYVRLQRNKIVKLAENKQVLTKRSKKLHTLDYVRLQRNKIVKLAENKQVLTKRSKKLHTLDYVRLQRNKIVKLAENKQVLTKRSKKLHTLDHVRLQRNKIVKLAENKQVLTRRSKKLSRLKRVAGAKRTKVKHNTKLHAPHLLAYSKPKKIQKITSKRTINHREAPVKLTKFLNRYTGKSVAIKRKREKKITLSDIFFKSSRASMLSKSIQNRKAANIINIAKAKLGKKYVWGAVGNKGTFDCSGFTSYVYKKNGIHIPRTSRNQAKYGKYISRNDLQKGDLIFFDTSKHRKGYVNHVGIYLGNGKFIHASSAQKRVVVSSLSKFYAQRYVGARRPS